MLLSPVYHRENKKAWENYVIFEDGYLYAFFGTGKKTDDNPYMSAIGLDVYRSRDGIHFEQISEYTNPIPGAHAGFCVKKIGDYFYYYPTCSNEEKGVHFKIYRTKNFKDWEHLGDEYDVVPDRRFYHDRWDEMVILEDTDNDGRAVYYGYITSEPRDDISAPGPGMLKSEDGIHWEVLPPAKVEWGEVPSQHMEVNFVEKIGEKYYLSMSGRLYLDSYGYSLYTFVGDNPFGPFYPDLEKFRLCGTSRRDITWLNHSVHTPWGLLSALWLSHDENPDIPSGSFAISTLKRILCENGHLRLGYWDQNDSLFDLSRPLNLNLAAAYPSETLKNERDSVVFDENGVIKISASRDGVILLSDSVFDKDKGIMLTGTLKCRENRGHIASHQHAAGMGFYLEEEPGKGVMIYADTLGVTRTGTLRYADQAITDFDIYRYSGYGLVRGRSGGLRGTVDFRFEDTVGPFGHASYAGIRHNVQHSFKLIARMDYFELYIDDLYVQTYLVPDTVTGRIGVCMFDGTGEIEIKGYHFL
ncbi:MAG: hypothetical protein J6I50_04820 [Clostridia bacterium]|nr:hypothetical protein [Clostridia bacterium]